MKCLRGHHLHWLTVGKRSPAGGAYEYAAGVGDVCRRVTMCVSLYEGRVEGGQGDRKPLSEHLL